MQPDSRGHERLMRKVYEGAGLDPCMTAFVEVDLDGPLLACTTLTFTG